MAGTRVIVKVDRVKQTVGAITSLVDKDVLVGIPETLNRRENEPINNAALGYIHEHGSPADNLPARPFLVPGIKAEQSQITAQLKKAVQSALDGQPAVATKFMERAGMIGMNGARKRISSNIPPPLRPGTIRARARSRGTRSRRAGERQYLAAIASGVSAAVAQSAAGIVSLINTGQLRRVITYVLRKRGK